MISVKCESLVLCYENISFQIGPKASGIFLFSKYRAFKVTVRASDPQNNTASGSVTVKVLNVADPPEVTVKLSRSSFPEDSKIGSTIANFTAKDPDPEDKVTCAVDKKEVFEIRGGLVVLKATLDFEKATEITFEVRKDLCRLENLVRSVSLTLVQKPASEVTCKNVHAFL